MHFWENLSYPHSPRLSLGGAFHWSLHQYLSFICLSIYLYLCLSLSISVYLSIYLSVDFSINPLSIYARRMQKCWNMHRFPWCVVALAVLSMFPSPIWRMWSDFALFLHLLPRVIVIIPQAYGAFLGSLLALIEATMALTKFAKVSPAPPLPLLLLSVLCLTCLMV